MSTITNPFSYYADGTTGRPLSNGFLYFGLPDTDPTVPANQVQVRSIGAGGAINLIPQPVTLNQSGVVVSTLNQPYILDIEEFNYSVVFQNSEGATVYSAPNVSSVFPPFSTEAGKFLFTDGTTISWESVLPDQSGESGNFLTTNGTIPSWGQVLPPQTITDAGKFLTTDGTNTSWEIALPDQTGEANKYLTTDGTEASWQTFNTTASVGVNQTLSDTSSVTVVFPPSGRLLVQSFCAATAGLGGSSFTMELEGISRIIITFADTSVGIISLIVIGTPNTTETFTSTIVPGANAITYNIVQTQPA